MLEGAAWSSRRRRDSEKLFIEGRILMSTSYGPITFLRALEALYGGTQPDNCPLGCVLWHYSLLVEVCLRL